VARLDGDAREGEHDPREHVDDDLLVDRRDLACALGAPAKDKVASDEAADERVVGTYNILSVRTPESCGGPWFRQL
jgi:hypothetical protein